MYGNPLFRYWWTVAQKGRQKQPFLARYGMNKERPIDDRAILILLLTSPPPCHLKGEVAEASLKAKE